MHDITLGSTGITVVQNCFGALPIQRRDKETAVKILRRAYEGGMRLFDTARAYTDSEEKLGEALKIYPRESYYITTKTTAKTPEGFWKDLETSLEKLQTSYIDVYQFHMVKQCWKPGDGSGMYECMEEAKKQGKIRHIGVTTHLVQIAEEIIESGLYETLQYPMSYISLDREIDLVGKCKEKNMGFICMKSLAGGLLTNTEAMTAFVSQFDNAAPIWGIQKEEELEEWLSYMDKEVSMTEEIRSFIGKEKKELSGDFCRGCGYCLPCPVDIEINNSARMSQLIRRSPSEGYLSPTWQEKMMRIESCLHCYQCASRCPYGLDTPKLLEKNLEDYKKILSGEVKI